MATLEIWLTLLLLASSANGIQQKSAISLTNNEYTGILIAINEDVAENATLIENIQEIFTNASSALYQATRQRAFFRNITILLPETWSNNFTDIAADGESFTAANIIVSPHNNVGKESPYTNQFDSCGKEAQYIHLTDKFILDSEWTMDTFGDPGKVIVHEWGHLRWGLFDEYPKSDDQHFYFNEKNEVEATRCSLSVVGDVVGENCTRNLEKGELPAEHCRFAPSQKNNQATGSYMYASFVDSIVDFCLSETIGDQGSLHNPMAPNQQNRLCSHRSAWDVMLDSEDFQNNTNRARHVADTTPSFRIVRSTPLRIVLVIDISGSMGGYIGIVHQILTKFIRVTVPDGYYIGIVEFESWANITSNLVQLETAQDREDLIDLLPTTVRGGTCIDCGLTSGIQVLEEDGHSPRGGILMLFTDENNISVKPTLMSEGVIVDTVSFEYYASDTLFLLSLDTGGHFYYYNGDPTELSRNLSETITSRPGGRLTAPIELSSEREIIEDGITGSTYIDATIGKNTRFLFLWESSPIFVVLQRPHGDIIDNTSFEYRSDNDTNMVSVVIFGIAEPGQWLYTIYGSSQTVEISIQSAARDNTQPIHITMTTSSSMDMDILPTTNIYAQVLRGYSPIIKATAVAVIERPSPYPPIYFQLFDNGAGADIIKGDGVYSRVFIDEDFGNARCQNCNYSVKVIVENNGDSAEVAVRTSKALPIRPRVGETTTQLVKVGQFNRVVSGGIIETPMTVPPGDNFPPSRIIDLRLVNTLSEDQTVTLAWTAPGDDLDRGTAAEYILRFSTNFSMFYKDFTVGDKISDDSLTAGNLSSPSPFGATEMVTVQILASEAEEAVYFLAVIARDAAGNEGMPSNIVSVAIIDNRVTTTSSTIIRTTSEVPSTGETSTSDVMDATASTTSDVLYSTKTASKVMNTVQSATEPVMQKSTSWLFLLIGCSAVAAVFILAFLCVAAVKWRKSKSKKKVYRGTDEEMQENPNFEAAE